MFVLLYGLLRAEPLEHPKINAQYFRPALDSQHFLSVNETTLGSCGSFIGRGNASQSSNPFSFVANDGDETEMIQSLDMLDLAGGFVFCRSRLGIHIPIILRAVGALPSGEELMESGIGDLLLDYKYRLSKPDDKIGIAVSLRGSAPTSTGKASVGNDGSMIEAEINLDTKYRKTVLALNIGHKSQATWSDEQSYFGSSIYARGGAALPLPYNSGIAAELFSSFMYGASSFAQAYSGELMLTGWKKFGFIALQAGMGYGLGNGIGSPDFRGLLGFAWLPKFAKKDTDRDGITNSTDQCPDKAEDIDGFQDTDGCPEPTRVIIRIMENGVELGDAQWQIGETKGVGSKPISLPSQVTTLKASPAGFQSIQKEIFIQGGEEQTIIVPMQRIQGTLQITPVDQNGAHISNATWSLVGSDKQFPTNEIASVAPDDINIRIMADGFKVVTHRLDIKANELSTLTIPMSSTKAHVKEDKIDFDGVILFRNNSAVIDKASFSILNDIGDALKDYPKIQEIRIEGHTDNVGSDSRNKRLSQERADSVRAFLIEYGIDPQRMIAKGFGEEQPVAENTTQIGKQKNRRVEFQIIKMATKEQTP